MKISHIVQIVSVIIVLIVVLVYIQQTEPPQGDDLVQGVLGGEALNLEVADSNTLREQGLSGHAPLEQDQGMLFVFDTPGRYGFWMKNMEFSIDIVWLGQDYRIVDEKQSADPASYPEVFFPKSPARYVLELPAGFFLNHHLENGNILQIIR